MRQSHLSSLSPIKLCVNPVLVLCAVSPTLMANNWNLPYFQCYPLTIDLPVILQFTFTKNTLMMSFLNSSILHWRVLTVIADWLGFLLKVTFFVWVDLMDLIRCHCVFISPHVTGILLHIGRIALSHLTLSEADAMPTVYHNSSLILVRHCIGSSSTYGFKSCYMPVLHLVTRCGPCWWPESASHNECQHRCLHHHYMSA